MSFTKVAPAGIGTNPGTSIRIGDSLLHSTGLDIGTGSGIGVTIRQHGDATVTGIVTAASFSGSGVNLTGVASTDHIKTSTTANFTDGIQVGGATTLTGNLTVSGNLGVGGVVTYEDVTNVDSIGVITARDGIRCTGIVTATAFHGDGANLTGVSGFATALGSTQGTLENIIFKTPEAFTIGSGTSVRVESDNSSGNIAFTRLNKINVSTGATFHVSAGTTFLMNVLGVF